MSKHTQEELAYALTVFIKSGSADGSESMRLACLKLIPVFSAAPELLEALIDVLDDHDAGYDTAHEQWEEVRNAIAKATKP